MQMLKTVIMDFSVIKAHFSLGLSRLFLSAGSQLSRIFFGRLSGLTQIAAGGRLSRSHGGQSQAFSSITVHRAGTLRWMVRELEKFWNINNKKLVTENKTTHSQNV